MSRPNLKLAGERSGGSPEREQLAEAIARHDEAINRLAAIQAARERTENARRDAKDAVKAAAAAVEAAKADAAAQLAGLGADPPLSVKAARAAQQDAEDCLEAAIAAGSTLPGHEKEAAAEVEYASTALDDRLRAVVKAEADVKQLLAEAKAAQAALVSLRVQLRYLFNENLVADQDTPPLRTFLLFENTLPTGRGQVEFGNFDNHPAAKTWKAALQELRENADAALPI
jgi:chromosome segregation ATPase